MRQNLSLRQLRVFGGSQHGAVSGDEQGAEWTVPVRAGTARDGEHLAHV